MKSLLARAGSVDAILAYNDLVAIGAMRALEEAGRSVPGEVAVIGADDVPYAALVRPALTTVRADISELGRCAMSRLLALCSGKELEASSGLQARADLQGVGVGSRSGFPDVEYRRRPA